MVEDVEIGGSQHGIDALARLFRKFAGLDGIEIGRRITDDDDPDHAHPVVRRALHDIGSICGKHDFERLVQFAAEGSRIGGDHALHRFNVVPFVDRYECYRVTLRDLGEGGFEHHRAVLALVQHLDFELRGKGWAMRKGENHSHTQNTLQHSKHEDLQIISNGCSKPGGVVLRPFI